MDDNGIPIPKGAANQGSVILGLDWVLFCLSTVIVLLRLATRTWITRNFGWDDATIALTQSTVAVGKAFVIQEVANGLGQHKQDLSPATYIKYMKYDYLDWAQVFISLPLTKISICLFLLRLSQFSRLKRLLHGLIAFIVSSHVPLFLLIVLQCNPVHKYWHTEVPGSCFRKETVEKIIIVQGVFSILTDFICAAFPAVLLWDAKIKRSTKTGLCLLLGLGVVTGIISIVRTAFSWQIKSNDATWVGIPNALTRLLEVNFGIIAACAPVMKPFVRYIQAVATGNDPHGLVRRGSSTKRSWHSQWYSRLRSRPSPPLVDHPAHRERPSRPSLPLIASEIKLRETNGVGVRLPTEGKGTTDSASFDLPLQGVTEAEDVYNQIPGLHADPEKGRRVAPRPG